MLASNRFVSLSPLPAFGVVVEPRASLGAACSLCASAAGTATPDPTDGLWKIMLGGAAVIFLIALI